MAWTGLHRWHETLERLINLEVNMRNDVIGDVRTDALAPLVIKTLLSHIIGTQAIIT